MAVNLILSWSRKDPYKMYKQTQIYSIIGLLSNDLFQPSYQILELKNHR